jgi:hypothetical protein
MAKYTSANFGAVALIVARPSVPMRENYGWLTDMIEAFDGTEERHALRSKPRISLNHKYEYDAVTKYDVFNTIYGALRSKFALPIWNQLQYVGSPTGTTITCNTTDYDFVDDELAFVYSSDESYVLTDITAVSGSSITVADSVTGLTNAYVMPAKVAYLSGDANIISTGLDGSLEVQYRIDSANTVVGDTPAQFLSNDIYYDPRFKGTGDVYQRIISAQQFLADYEMGKISEQAPWNNNRVSQVHEFLLKTRAEYKSFINWLSRREGRYRQYWRPSFEKDFSIVSAGTLTTTIDVKKASFIDWSSNRLHFAIQDVAGSWYPRAVTNVASLNATDMRLTFPTLSGLAVANIRRMCYLGLHRLVQDVVELNWIGGKICKCDLADIEISP